MSEVRVVEDDDRPFFTQGGLAKKLTVSERKVRQMIERKEIRAFKIGRAVRIAPQDVDSYLASQCQDEAA